MSRVPFQSLWVMVVQCSTIHVHPTPVNWLKEPKSTISFEKEMCDALFRKREKNRDLTIPENLMIKVRLLPFVDATPLGL